MTERENGWYLRSEGYMTSEYSYQRIEAMEGNRALDNHQKLVFVEFMGGEEKDSCVYVPHPGTCEMVTSGTPCEGNTDVACTCCGAYNIGEYYDGYGHRAAPKFCPECGRKVKR